MRLWTILMTVVGLSAPALAPGQPDPDYVLHCTDDSVMVGETASTSVGLDVLAPAMLDAVQGWTYGLCNNTMFVSNTGATIGLDASLLNGGLGPDFHVIFPVPGGAGFEQAAVTSFPGTATFPFGLNYQLAVGTYLGLAPPGSPLTFCNTVVSPPTVPVVVVQADNVEPVLNNCFVTVLGLELLITEICDGTLPGGRPRWVEITNCGPLPVDLGLFSIGNLNNGQTTLGGGASIPLDPVMLGEGASYIFEYDNGMESVFESVYGFLADQQAGGNFINGDDVVALFFGLAVDDGMGGFDGTIVDVYGEIGVDGSGELWEYTDGYARRLPGSPPQDTFDPSQWFFGGAESLDGGDPALHALLTSPGTHQCAGAVACDPVIGLDCTSDCGSGNVILSWSNTSPYDGIDIRRNGAVIATLPGGNTSYTDVAVVPGVYEYDVLVTCGGLSALTGCELVHCPPPPDGSLLITEVCDGALIGLPPDEDPTPRWVEITNCGMDTIDLQFYSIGNLNNGAPTLGGGASTSLSGSLGAGESFVFAYDTPTNSRFNEVYGFDPDQFAGGGFINGNDVVALFYGPATDDGMGGVNGTFVDVYGEVGTDGGGEAWEYTDGYARRLPDAIQQGMTFDPAQWLFGGVDSVEGMDDPSNVTLLQENTFPAAHECTGPVGPFFIRADCDGDGILNGILDGLAALNFQFQGVPVPPCLRACDADGDRVFNGLLDGLRILNFQFIPGSPPPAPPFPDCSEDPNDTLTCDASSCTP